MMGGLGGDVKDEAGREMLLLTRAKFEMDLGFAEEQPAALTVIEMLGGCSPVDFKGEA